MLFNSLAASVSAALMALEHSALGQAARGSAWLYPLANMAHVLGAALLLGAIATFDIQVLRRVGHARVVYNAVVPIATFGVVLQFVSGFVVLSADAAPVVANPAFQFKMAFLVLALANVAMFRWRFGGRLKADAPLEGATLFAAISLVSWTLVLLAGRFIAYL